jgi:hypothetical protein
MIRPGVSVAINRTDHLRGLRHEGSAGKGARRPTRLASSLSDTIFSKRLLEEYDQTYEGHDRSSGGMSTLPGGCDGRRSASSRDGKG